MESILQKSVAVHATHDRLVMMVSALLHAMEESKTAANVQAVRNAKTAKEKQRATYFAGLVHAQLGLSSKNKSSKKHNAAKTSPKADGRPAVPPRHLGNKCEASAPTRPIVPPLFGKRAISSSHLASRLRQVLTESLAPLPKLSAHYDLVSASSPSAASMLSPPVKFSKNAQTIVANSPRPGLIDGVQAIRPRPATSPTKRSVSIDLKMLSSSKSAAMAYGDSVVFVEPSPLHKRLPHRGGVLSAGGVRRRLSARRYSGKRLDSLTPRASPPGSMDASSLFDCVGGTRATPPAASPLPSPSLPCAVITHERSLDERSPAGAAMLAIDTARPLEGQQDADADSSQGERRPDDGDKDDDDESYDDDFSPPDDVDETEEAKGEKETTDTNECRDLPGRIELAHVESDNELMDMMLADLAPQEPDIPSQRAEGSSQQALAQASTCVPDTTASSTIEVEAATCIQRHVRGMSARRRVTVGRDGKTRTRSMTDYKPKSVLKAAKLQQDKHQSRARRTRSLAVGDTRSASLKRPAVSHATEPLRSRSRSPSPVPVPSRSPASSSLGSILSTRKHRSVSVAAHRSLFQANTPVKKSASHSGGSRRATTSSAPRASVSTADFDVKPKTAGAQDQKRDHGSSTSDAVASPAPNTNASPSAVPTVTADALFGGPDPLRRLQDLYAEGLRLHSAGQIAEAAASYESALALAPTTGRDFASVHLNLGSARMAMGDAAGALAAFREARRVQPASAKAAFNEALALLRLGRTREATRMVSCLLVVGGAGRRLG